MNTFSTTAEYYSALSSKFNNGGYGNLKHPEMAQWFANKESAYGIIADTEAIISCLSDDDKRAATRAAFRSFRSMIRDVIRYAEFPNIHELPSACIIIAIDDSYDTIEKVINIKEDNTMKDVIKEQMQAGIDNCSNTISFDEFDAKAEEAERKINMEITDGEEKIISSPRKNNIADICNIINIASTIILAIKSYSNKRNTGKYRVNDLAITVLSGYITGSSIKETYKEFPNSRFGRLYHNVARFAKKVVEAAKKLVVKTTRKEGDNNEER